MTPPPVPGNEAAKELAANGKAMAQKVVQEIGRVVVGMEGVTRQLLIALLGRRPRVARRRARRGQDDAVEGLRPSARLRILARAVHARPAAVRRDRHVDLRSHGRTNSCSAKGRSSARCCSADEINRAPAKTQSALLEAMQEYQVTIEGTTLPLPRPFMVMATQNPVEQEGVYRLPEAQLDRFLLRVEMGYPGHDAEVRMLRVHSQALAELEPMFDPESILQMQNALEQRVRQRRVDALHRRVWPRKAGSIRTSCSAPAHERRCACSSAPAARRARWPALLHARGRAGSRARRARPSPDRAPEAEVEGRHVSDIVRDVLESVPVLEST